MWNHQKELNSIQAIKDRGEITIRYYRKDDQRIAIEISDDGEGVSSDLNEKVFEPFFTTKDSNPGLEVLSPDGRWVSAEPVEGAIVVNVADFLMRWTNGVYKSTIHRVVNRTDKERYSVPLFFSINYDETVETLPSCVSEENPSKFPPITAGKYVLDRLALTVKTGKY